MKRQRLPRLLEVVRQWHIPQPSLWLHWMNLKKILNSKKVQEINSWTFHIYLQNRIREILPSETPTPSLFLPSSLSGHALDRLVIVSSMHCCTSTSILSTSSSSRGLTGLTPGISHLEGGFTLRCLQRLSRPGLATLPCAWRRNRSTSGQSIPVLSY